MLRNMVGGILCYNLGLVMIFDKSFKLESISINLRKVKKQSITVKKL